MALRMSSRRAGVLFDYSCRASLTASKNCKRNASAAAVPTSSDPAYTDSDILVYTLPSPNVGRSKLTNAQKESSLSNPDPPVDSSTARLTQSHAPYMVPTYVRPPPMMAKGEGCYLWDVENRKYLDFTAGIAVNALGHCDPEMSKLLYQQSQTLVHTSNLYHNPWIGALSQLLVDKTIEAGGMATASKVFVCNSGSEANEAAIKFCRKVGRKRTPDGSQHEIVSFNNSFHGRTMGSLSATPNPKYQAPFSPMVPGFRYGTFNDGASIPDLITPQTCGVLVEPIQGEGGVNVASHSFLQALRDRCNEVGAVLVYDEIQCGLSRTGKLWAHASLPKSAHPDILTTAKALGNGFPIGATIVSEEVSNCVVTGDHGTTFGGNPLACRLSHYILSRLSSPEMQAGVLTKERVFREGFEKLRSRFPSQIKEIRGRGLLLGIQLDQDPTPIVTAARERGLLIITCGTNTLRLVPPLVISEGEIDEGLKILEEAMGVVFEAKESVKGTKGQQEMAPKGR